MYSYISVDMEGYKGLRRMEINFWVFLVEGSCLDPNLGRTDRLGKHGSYVRDSFNGYTHLLGLILKE